MPAPLLVAAGWVLVTPTALPPALRPRLPPVILTVSDCLQEDLPQPPGGTWFTDRDAADRARAEHAPHASVVGVALTSADGAALCAQAVPDPYDALAVLRRQKPVGPEQRVLGWELVGAQDWFDLCSWHCHGYADEVATALGIRTNSRGLLASHAEASTVLHWMLTRPSAEAPAPVPWFPVALTASPAAERALAHDSRP